MRKDDMRVEAYGTVDELNSHIGLLAEMLRSKHEKHYAELKVIQNKLFDIQTLLATEDADISRFTRPRPVTGAEATDAGTEEAAALYMAMDSELQQLIARLPVRPGSIPTVLEYYESTDAPSLARKLRSIEAFKKAEIDDTIMRFLNRLSDYLFVLARLAVVADGTTEDLYTN